MSGKASSSGTRLALTEDCHGSVQRPFWKEYARNLEGLEIKSQTEAPYQIDGRAEENAKCDGFLALQRTQGQATI